MEPCRVCGDAASYSCSYCGRGHCPDHRLPEAHDCPRANSARSLGPELRGGSAEDFDGCGEDGSEEYKLTTKLVLAPLVAVIAIMEPVRLLLTTKAGLAITCLLALVGVLVIGLT